MNPAPVTLDLATIFGGDIIGSGDTITLTGPVNYQVKEIKCTDSQVCTNEIVIYTGYFKTYTSPDLGVTFSVFETNEITSGSSYSIITRKDNQIFQSEYGDIPIITVYKKEPGVSTADEVKAKFFQATDTGCTVGDYNIFEWAGFDVTNKKSNYEYVGMIFSGKLTDELKIKYDCSLGSYDICNIRCTTGAGVQSDQGAMVFYLGKKESSTYLLVQGGQDYLIWWNLKNQIETIEIIK